MENPMSFRAKIHGKTGEIDGDGKQTGKERKRTSMGKLGDFISKLGISPSFFPTADPSSWCSAMLCFPMGMDGDSQVHGG
jgi:hypothetical protein